MRLLKYKSKSLLNGLIILFTLSIMVAVASVVSTSNVKAIDIQDKTSDEQAASSDSVNLENHQELAPVVTTRTAQGDYTADYVYSDDPHAGTPPDAVYEEDPDTAEQEPEPEPEPDPDPQPSPDPETDTEPDPEEETDQDLATDTETDPNLIEYDEIKITIAKDEIASGSVDVPVGATVKIGKHPSNGSARVDQDGNWEYVPNPGFTGEDEFTIVINHEDGSKKIITFKILVEDVIVQPVAGSDNALPSSGGITLAAIVTLWFFVIASYSLRVGIIKTRP